MINIVFFKAYSLQNPIYLLRLFQLFANLHYTILDLSYNEYIMQILNVK